MSKCVLPVLAKGVDTESVILAACKSHCGFLCISELAAWFVKLMTQTFTVIILGPVREGFSISQIMPEMHEAGVFPCCLLGSLLLLWRDVFTSGKFDTGVSSWESAGRMHWVGQQRQPWAQPRFQLGVTVCVSEKLVMNFCFPPKCKLHISELLARLSFNRLSF